ncbi:RluA family pseudouridine synthase [Ohessyouella blattaphilus]|uniref:Pseudouridine synthase n=1 Tax=Ohessyouella blattaphilus TaxID=2949333 RepID=A0ABT1EET5_9FIRM|nr:RluA family pseudouridine synthase [Ohessyouella blattaphilus]MCP1109222.1 RluA family pseudouridine synthase [Ohessyouella blattaphilus]MCR8562616.1 RluA family pseudouridine synthase [Ohessyouella blattaphilus]
MILKKYFTVAESDNERIDKFLSEELEDISRSRIQKLIKDGCLSINGKTAKASYILQAGDELALEIPALKEPEIPAEDIPLEILYEDDDLIFVNKPKGMVVHPAPGHYTGTLVNALMYHFKDSLSGINGELRPGIVHRIDMDTTGVLVVCKNDKAHAALSEQLKEHSITRVYEAIVTGNIKEDTLTIDKPIGRDIKDRKKMSIHSKTPREAVTHVQVLKRFGDYTYIKCQLETGRTHQIRVHLKSIGHPLLGDSLYGPKNAPFKNLQGQTLHARILGVLQPTTGEHLEIEAPLPDYFSKLLEIMG